MLDGGQSSPVHQSPPRRTSAAGRHAQSPKSPVNIGISDFVQLVRRVSIDTPGGWGARERGGGQDWTGSPSGIRRKPLVDGGSRDCQLLRTAPDTSCSYRFRRVRGHQPANLQGKRAPESPQMPTSCGSPVRGSCGSGPNPQARVPRSTDGPSMRLALALDQVVAGADDGVGDQLARDELGVVADRNRFRRSGQALRRCGAERSDRNAKRIEGPLRTCIPDTRLVRTRTVDRQRSRLLPFPPRASAAARGQYPFWKVMKPSSVSVLIVMYAIAVSSNRAHRMG